MKVKDPADPRLAPLIALRRFMPLPPKGDAEEQAERRILEQPMPPERSR